MFTIAALEKLTLDDIRKISARDLNHPEPTMRQGAQLQVGFYTIRTSNNPQKVLRGFDMLWDLFLGGSIG